MSTELRHHGILGMKWGIRRFQNKDGTLTAAGKAKYSKNNDIIKQKQKASENQKRADVKKRGILSDAELRQKIERIKMEKMLKDLTDEELNPGKTAIKRTLKQIGNKVVTTAVTGAALYGIKAAVSKDFNAKEFGNAVFNGGPKKK